MVVVMLLLVTGAGAQPRTPLTRALADALYCKLTVCVTTTTGDARYLRLAGTSPMAGQLTLAATGLSFPGSTSGTTSLVATAIAGTTALTLQAVTGTIYSTGGTDVAVADGGTSLSTLTLNNVILGNGTSTPLFVAPNTSGNVLTSNGTTWASVAFAGITASSTDTLTNKSISLTTNTLSGTLTEFNTALSGADFVSLAGSESLTNKTFAFGSNTVSGTTAQFNTALSDNDFATLVGSETLTNKSISGATNTISALAASTITSGTLATARGGTNADSSASTGIAHVATGTWSFSSVVSADLNITTTSCTSQFVTAISATGVGTCTTITLAGAQFANQGTTTTVLHGNAAGNPLFGKVVDGDITFTAPVLGAPTATTVQTSGNIGAGAAPSGTTGELFTATSSGDVPAQIKSSNTNASGTTARASIVASADTAVMNVNAHGTGRTTSRFGVAIGGYAELLASAGNGLLFGTNGATPILVGTNATTVLKIDGANGNIISLPLNVATAGTMTGTYESVLSAATTCRAWTNDQVVALGATTAGDIAWGTLPIKNIVRNAYIVITGAGAGPAALTVSLGRTSASYIDYIVASDAKAAANTLYGDASAERGTNLTGYDLASYTATTLINAHFISTGANLSTVTSSTGLVCITLDKLQ